MPGLTATPPTNAASALHLSARPARDRAPDLTVPFDQWSASAMNGTRMRTGRVNVAERQDELSKINRGLIPIVRLRVGVFSRQPLVNRPLERITLGGASRRHRHRRGP